ncbi:hypothetical protein [Leuconostoc citreum]|uniref:hypothetical protein n=1 Tax=Leuconostoc citreum TaxID=33964 RepID=UPI002A7EE1A1|nr:hypothetical protein [Leuconostoc citreum]MDY5162775.1 hypothetical protein [Leuconostoc citreum]MDY5166386.1 hypothetical protein [Leuconostoc citreum]
MNNFEIQLPDDHELNLSATDTSLYKYNFASYSLAPLQKLASKNLTTTIRESVFTNTANTNLVNNLRKKNETEYVAKLSDSAKEKIKTGEWSFGIKKKTGETYGVIKDTKTGKNQSFLALDKKTVTDLGNLPELAAIQAQLASIAEAIENLNHLIQRVEQGQYNDRFAGFFSARQLIIEGLQAKDEFAKKSLLLNAIQTNNETIARLALSIHQDGLALSDPRTTNKDAQRIDNLIQSSIGYLNSSVQLNLIAYTDLHEEKSLFASLTNYRTFINDNLLQESESGKTIAWLIDNGHSGENGNVLNTAKKISTSIQSLITTYESSNMEKIENEKDNREKM